MAEGKGSFKKKKKETQEPEKTVWGRNSIEGCGNGFKALQVGTLAQVANGGESPKAALVSPVGPELCRAKSPTRRSRRFASRGFAIGRGLKASFRFTVCQAVLTASLSASGTCLPVAAAVTFAWSLLQKDVSYGVKWWFIFRTLEKLCVFEVQSSRVPVCSAVPVQYFLFLQWVSTSSISA